VFEMIVTGERRIVWIEVEREVEDSNHSKFEGQI